MILATPIVDRRHDSGPVCTLLATLRPMPRLTPLILPLTLQLLINELWQVHLLSRSIRGIRNPILDPSRLFSCLGCSNRHAPILCNPRSTVCTIPRLLQVLSLRPDFLLVVTIANIALLSAARGTFSLLFGSVRGRRKVVRSRLGGQLLWDIIVGSMAARCRYEVPHFVSISKERVVTGANILMVLLGQLLYVGLPCFWSSRFIVLIEKRGLGFVETLGVGSLGRGGDWRDESRLVQQLSLAKFISVRHRFKFAIWKL